MNILINFATLKAGGGQNVALNFLSAIHHHIPEGTAFVFLVASRSEIHRTLIEMRVGQIIQVPRSAIWRIIFECVFGWFWLVRHRIDVIYSYFGYAWLPRRWPQVSGAVDSNLFFPEIDFWEEHTGLARLKRWLMDKYRLHGIRRASALIFENAALMERAKVLYGLDESKLIRPSIYIDDAGEKYSLPPGLNVTLPIGLFLCGWQIHKNILQIPALAAALRSRGRAMSFLLTAAADGSPLSDTFEHLVTKLGVSDLVFLCGAVKKSSLKDLYRQVNYVMLLSKLESFSNNIIEAWHFGVPLVVSDAAWAKAICGEAAIYVRRDSVDSIADTLSHLMAEPPLREEVVASGRRELAKYPSTQERASEEIDYVRMVCEKRKRLPCRLV